MSPIEIELAAATDKIALQNMMQLYIHDFTEQWIGLSDVEIGRNAAFAHLNAEGRFPDYPLDAYWTEDGRVPLLIKENARPVGFALLNQHTHSSRPADRNMAEFFIVRRHRRKGLGTNVAQRIFSSYPGQWEVSVLRRNVGALVFWRKAISAHPALGQMDELDLKSDAWDGTIFRFQIQTTK